jgi:Fe-S cluster biogenesis protein NfuA
MTGYETASSRGVCCQIEKLFIKGGFMKEKVEKVLNEIRPMLQRDGGDVELVGIEGGIVKVRLQGACAGCPMSQMTLRNGIERVLMDKIPEVKAVEPAD